MTDGEIQKSYREAAHKRAQVKILADLNVCSTAEIREVLGLVKPEPKKTRPTLPAAVETLIQARIREIQARLEELTEEADKLSAERAELQEFMKGEKDGTDL